MKEFLRSISGKAFLASVVVTLPLSLLVGFLLYKGEKEADFLKAEQRAIAVKSQLESALNESVAASKIFAFLLERDLAGMDFDSTAEAILSKNKNIDALQWVRGNTIIRTFPLKGNEASIGYAVMDVPEHRAEALEAVARGELYFEGPINLKQGGKGFVGRYPIFKGDTLAGFSAVIVRMETFLRALEMDESGKDEMFSYQLVKKNRSNQAARLLFEGAGTFEGECRAKRRVPIGDWVVYVKLNDPPHVYKGVLFIATGILISLMLSLIYGFLREQPRKLEELVSRKTRTLDEVNAALEQQTAQLKRSNTDLEQFAYAASHDLQEPLRMVSSFLKLLERKYEGQLDDKANEYIHYAVDGANRMRRIILDLLEYSQSGTHADDLTDIKISEVIEEVAVLQSKIMEEKEAKLTFDHLPTVRSHRSQLVRIFQNLIGNALKYARPGISPEINVTAEDRGELWQFSIVDNGIGIAPENFERIFQLFGRLKQNPEVGGTGMGLSTVKRIVERLGGSIRVVSEHGQGSTFIFTLPKQPGVQH